MLVQVIIGYSFEAGRCVDTKIQLLNTSIMYNKLIYSLFTHTMGMEPGVEI